MADEPSQPSADPNTTAPSAPATAPVDTQAQEAAPVADPTTLAAVPTDPAPAEVAPAQAPVGDQTATEAPIPPAPSAPAPGGVMAVDAKIRVVGTNDAGKRKKMLKFIVPIVAVVLLGGAIGGGGYFFGFWGKKNSAEVPQVLEPTPVEASNSAVVQEPTLITPDCVSGYKPYVNKQFSICYPITMDVRERPASESAEAATEYIFEDNIETLRVLTEYKGNLNKFECASSKVVKVATYSALRYQKRDVNPKGGCAGTVNEYASLVSAGNEKPIFYIGLSRKKGSYQSDNSAFAAIEQSFRINLP